MTTTGTIYTETVVHMAPAQFVDDAPYQIAIVQLDDGPKVTGRIVAGDRRVSIGDRVSLVEHRNQIPYFALLNN
jgi:uncharacterized OB-fold protein